MRISIEKLSPGPSVRMPVTLAGSGRLKALGMALVGSAQKKFCPTGT
jgi:hypothetical protein